MGNAPNVEYPIGANVEARYDGNQSTYHPAKIVKKHEYGRYDVKFASNGKIMTVFWDDIHACVEISVPSSHTSPASSNTNHNDNTVSLTKSTHTNLNHKSQQNNNA
eukprot:172014_1